MMQRPEITLTRSPVLMRALLLGGLGMGACLQLAIAQGPPPARVRVTTVESSGEQSTAEFVGTTAPYRHSVVGSAVEGRVLDVLVDEGDYLAFKTADGTADVDSEDATEEGGARPAMVRIRTATLEIQIKSAEASLAVGERELELLRESLPIEVAQATAELDAADAALQSLKAAYDRQADLMKSNPGAVSQELLDAARSQWISAKSSQLSTEKRLTLLRETQELKIDQASAQVEVERQALNLLKDQLEKYTIRAPFPGFVAVQHAEVGDWIQRGDPVIEVMQLNPLELRVNVPEEYIARVYRAMELAKSHGKTLEAEVSFQAVPGQVFQAEVVRIVPQADLRTRSFPVLLHIQNPDQGEGPILKSGMLARAKLPVGGRDQRLLVPKDAIVLQKQGDRDVGYQLIVADRQPNEGGQESWVARVVPVEVGEATGSQIEVRGNLLAGEKIVVEGNERVRPGQPLILIDEGS